MRRLGKGLADLIEPPASTAVGGVATLRLDQIRAGRFQPRSAMSEEGLEELKASIRRTGVIEPIVVRPSADGLYELVAGERRFRASQAIGKTEIPVVVRTLSDKEAVEFSLIENIQRENLNPIDEAKGYTRLLEEFGYTQEEVAQAVGKDRATVANIVRLLMLPEEIQQAVRQGLLMMGHARALLAVEDRAQQMALYRQAIGTKLTVRQVEALAAKNAKRRRPRLRHHDPHLQAIEDQLQRVLGTKVILVPRENGGRMMVEYFSSEDLARILQTLGVAA